MSAETGIQQSVEFLADIVSLGEIDSACTTVICMYGQILYQTGLVQVEYILRSDIKGMFGRERNIFAAIVNRFKNHIPFCIISALFIAVVFGKGSIGKSVVYIRTPIVCDVSTCREFETIAAASSCIGRVTS